MLRGFTFYPQSEAMNCGPACLRMIARHHGKFYTENYLREITNTGIIGSTLYDLSQASEQIGLKTLALEVGLKDLEELVPLPCIVPYGFQHFAVLYRIHKGRFWLADPARGKFSQDLSGFVSKWTAIVGEKEVKGVVLAYQTTPEFYHKNTLPEAKPWSFLWAYFKPYQSVFYQVIVGLLLGSMLQLLFPFFLKSVVDTGIGNQDLSFIVLVLIAQLVLFLTRIAVEYLRNWNVLHLESRVYVTLLFDFINKLTRLPYRYFDTRHTADHIQRIQEHERIQSFIGSAGLISLFALLNAIGSAVILSFWDINLFLLFATGTLFSFAWAYGFLRWRNNLEVRRSESTRDNQVILTELAGGMQDMKLYQAGNFQRRVWEDLQIRQFGMASENLKREQIQKAGALFFTEIRNLLVLLYVSNGVLASTLTVGMLVGVQYIIGQLNSQVNDVLEFLKSAQNAHLSLLRISSIHEQETEDSKKNLIQEIPIAGSLALEEVSFSYFGVSTKPVLRNLNLLIPRGNITCILGPSGSGKSTLLKLLLNLYEPSQGKLTLDSVALHQFHPDAWRKQAGAVMQDSQLFSASIASNVALGDIIPDPDRLNEAARLVNLSPFLESLPQGWQTKVGPQGQGISQGQRQRILLARAIYRQPEFLFLDEATSSLDSFSEMLILENLKEAFSKKTIIVVSHRLYSILDPALVVLMDEGEIIEMGKPEELLLMQGAYYQLVRNAIELGS